MRLTFTCRRAAAWKKPLPDTFEVHRDGLGPDMLIEIVVKVAVKFDITGIALSKI